MTRSAGGSPARSRARRRASFPKLYFFLGFFLAKVSTAEENATQEMAEACGSRTHDAIGLS